MTTQAMGYLQSQDCLRCGWDGECRWKCGVDILKLVLNKVFEVLGEGQRPGLRNPAVRLDK